MSDKTLLVWPNPFHAVDHEGCPAGILPYEPVGDGVNSFDERRFVGATLTAKILQKFPVGDARQTVQRTGFKYNDEPTTVPATAYYQHAVQRGEIFAGDEASAARCGIKDSFVAPGKLLELAREAAIGLWKREGHDHHEGEVPETLSKFSFGPMAEAIAARKKNDEESKKGDEEAKKVAAKKAADEEAKKKSAGDKPRGGE